MAERETSGSASGDARHGVETGGETSSDAGKGREGGRSSESLRVLQECTAAVDQINDHMKAAEKSLASFQETVKRTDQVLDRWIALWTGVKNELGRKRKRDESSEKVVVDEAQRKGLKSARKFGAQASSRR